MKRTVSSDRPLGALSDSISVSNPYLYWSTSMRRTRSTVSCTAGILPSAAVSRTAGWIGRCYGRTCLWFASSSACLRSRLAFVLGFPLFSAFLCFSLFFFFCLALFFFFSCCLCFPLAFVFGFALFSACLRSRLAFVLGLPSFSACLRSLRRPTP